MLQLVRQSVSHQRKKLTVFLAYKVGKRVAEVSDGGAQVQSGIFYAALT